MNGSLFLDEMSREGRQKYVHMCSVCIVFWVLSCPTFCAESQKLVLAIAMIVSHILTDFHQSLSVISNHFQLL